MGDVIRNRGGRRTAGAKGINGRVSEFILDRESKMFHEVATRLIGFGLLGGYFNRICSGIAGFG